MQEEVIGDFKPKRTKAKKVLYSCLILFVLIFFGLVWYGLFVEPYRVEIRNLWIEDSRLGKILEDKIAVHLSDLHMSKIGRREQRVLNILNGLGPDIIFLTGDYVFWKGDYEASLIFLSKLKAKIGIWAVMGDYDYSRSRKSCLFCHEQGSGKPTYRHRVRFLRNEFEQVSLEKGIIWIGGIDRDALATSVDDGNFVSGFDRGPLILLAHNPLEFDHIDEDQQVLMLAGDTHGGQLLLPSWLWSILDYEKNAKYNQGLFQKGQKKMVVSQGVGTSHLPIRIFRRPEVVVLHFEGKQTADHRPMTADAKKDGRPPTKDRRFIQRRMNPD